MPRHPRTLRATTSMLVLLLAALFAACGGTRAGGTAAEADAPPAATTAATVASAPTLSAGSPAARSTPEAARAMAHLRKLAGDIGPRAATTDGERRAAEYLRDELERAGYRATLEPFEVDVTIGGTATLRPDGAAEVPAAPMNGSPDGTASGPLVVVPGVGRPEDFAGVAARGAIAVVERGVIPFAEKARNAQQAGAAAMVVLNNQGGLFRGDLGAGGATIPVVGVAQEVGGTLRSLASSGTRATVTTSSERIRGTSHNVVGRPSAGPCSAYLGAHYDSVPEGPGANDNASGTALLMELARARRLEGVCVVAFGAEEIGLIGSRAFVRAEGVAGARFMLNFDMVAKNTRPTLIGDEDLASRAARLAEARSFTLRRTTSIGPGASSDHASFQQAGVPALMFYSGDDQFIHTAQDGLANVSEADLAKFLDLAVAVLDDLTGR